MPLINGQKMACEPCIRGHRSTKCSHANERLMVPVRRPGRPLSSCPHPPTRPCQCAAVTAAIPKKQKCRCETSSAPVAASQVPEPEEQASCADVAPLPGSSKGPDTLGHRVHKSVSRSRANRKPIDPAALERMDASQVNIMSATTTTTTTSTTTPTPTDSAGSGVMQFVSPEAYVADLPPQSDGLVHPSLWNLAALADGHHGHANGCETTSRASSSGQSQPDSDALQKSPKRCCGSGAHSAGSESAGGSQPTPALAPTPAPTPAHPLDHYQMNGGLMASSLPVQMAMPHGIFPYVPHQSVFAYPPHYGSFLQPLQPEQWRHLMAGPGYAVPSPGASTYGASPSVPAALANHLGGSGSGSGSSWTSHQCGCGDSCQCVGCASHPYNEATQNYVRSAWAMMMEEPPQKAVARHEAPPPNSNSNSRSSSSGNNNNGDATPGAPEEQILSANDFFFVSYPFRTCEGEMASCPCGDDCACPGCAMHSRPA